mmetsp:Transcript_38670/g.109341  ORF Transcript_38670/g.109341 Transcript_38670/m.109341 type:complete len:256 (-) Transcript_38670:961-1728(-)
MVSWPALLLLRGHNDCFRFPLELVRVWVVCCGHPGLQVCDVYHGAGLIEFAELLDQAPRGEDGGPLDGLLGCLRLRLCVGTEVKGEVTLAEGHDRGLKRPVVRFVLLERLAEEPHRVSVAATGEDDGSLADPHRPALEAHAVLAKLQLAVGVPLVAHVEHAPDALVGHSIAVVLHHEVRRPVLVENLYLHLRGCLVPGVVHKFCNRPKDMRVRLRHGGKEALVHASQLALLLLLLRWEPRALSCSRGVAGGLLHR